MHVIVTRNAHEALPSGLLYLRNHGVAQDSRNGPVLVSPCPVTTVYERPTEKVVLWPARDYNVFFCIYEALWMLAGRDDVAGVKRYIRTFGNYSDDGISIHDAYGYRWRFKFGRDQLPVITAVLHRNHTDRRAVLQMWHSTDDLGRQGKTVPCNLMATFQISPAGRLDMTVFCRSNDIIWGAYFANAFHFGLLLEYMAGSLGVPVGVYNQVSVNYHAYRQVFDPLVDAFGSQPNLMRSYAMNTVQPVPLYGDGQTTEQLDTEVKQFLWFEERDRLSYHQFDSPFLDVAARVLSAHAVYRKAKSALAALEILDACSATGDIVASAVQWLERRRDHQQ